MREVRYPRFDTKEGFPSSPIFWVLPIPALFLIYIGNPATSLPVDAAVSLLLNCQGLLKAHLIGQRALQIVVVLIWLNLDTKQLVVISVPIIKHTDSTLFDENGNLALKLESRALSNRGLQVWLRR